MRKSVYPNHVVHYGIEHDVYMRRLSKPHSLESPADYLLVDRLGDRKVATHPVAVSEARVGFEGVLWRATYLERPPRESAEKYIQAHRAVVAPIQNYMYRRGSEAARVGNDSIGTVRTIMAFNRQAVAVSHVLYEGEQESGGPVTANEILVSRAITRTNTVYGTVRDYDPANEGCDIPLRELVAQESEGIETNLRTYHSVESRALGAVGLLLSHEMVLDELKPERVQASRRLSGYRD